MDLKRLKRDLRKLKSKIQDNLYTKANTFRDQKTNSVTNYDEFKQLIQDGGFVYAHWDGTTETEKQIKLETKSTIRCIPLNSQNEDGICIYSGKKSKRKVLFAIPL